MLSVLCALHQADNRIGEDVVNPEERAGLFSILTFSWMNPLLAAGYKAPLLEEDVWKIGHRDTAEVRIERTPHALYVKMNPRRVSILVISALHHPMGRLLTARVSEVFTGFAAGVSLASCHRHVMP